MTAPTRDALWQTIHESLPPTDDSAELAADQIRAAVSPFMLLPKVEDGCCCTGYSEDRGGGYFELMAEYEPACPEHSTHVYNPRTGMWDFAPKPESAIKAEGWTEGYRAALAEVFEGVTPVNPYLSDGIEAGQ